MKLIIDIPTEHYNEIVFQDVDKLRECVKNGTVVVNKAGVDCVNRLDVLAILLKAYNESHFDGYSDYCAVSDLVADLPSISLHQKWIPVTERLPENQDCYLVTTKWKGSWSGDVYIETNMAVYRERPKEWDCKDVIAWMPLPEPYKAESEVKADDN